MLTALLSPHPYTHTHTHKLLSSMVHNSSVCVRVHGGAAALKVFNVSPGQLRFGG